jgi:hypothetical protein
MMFPTPEPAADIAAQIDAVMNPAHPKKAAFIVPADREQVRHCLNACVATRDEGTLVTTLEPAADAFLACDSDPDAFDNLMAVLLGIPEQKPLMVQNCRGRPELYARAVQARDSEGNVVQEAFASPAGLHETILALEAHVPHGGVLVVMKPADAIQRRIDLR